MSDRAKEREKNQLGTLGSGNHFVEIGYVAELKVYAAYDVMELTAEDLAEDHRAEIARLIEEIGRGDAQSLEDEVARLLKFDLCPACQGDFLRDTRAWHASGSTPR